MDGRGRQLPPVRQHGVDAYDPAVPVPTKLDQVINRLARYGRAVIVIGAVVLALSFGVSIVHYRQNYGTFQPFARFPERLIACGRVYLGSPPGPYDSSVVASSTTPVGHTPGATVYSSQPCRQPGCHDADTDPCPVPTAVVVRYGARAAVYSLSGGP